MSHFYFYFWTYFIYFHTFPYTFQRTATEFGPPVLRAEAARCPRCLADYVVFMRGIVEIPMREVALLVLYRKNISSYAAVTIYKTFLHKLKKSKTKQNMKNYNSIIICCACNLNPNSKLTFLSVGARRRLCTGLRTADCRLQTADCGPGIKCRLCVKLM